MKTSRQRLGLMIGAATLTVAAGVVVAPQFAGAASKPADVVAFTITVGMSDGSTALKNPTTVKLICDAKTGKPVNGNTHPNAAAACAQIKRNNNEFYLKDDGSAADPEGLKRCNAKNLPTEAWMITSQNRDQSVQTSTGYNNSCEMIAIEGAKAKIGRFARATV